MAFLDFGIFLLGIGHYHGVSAIEQCCSLSFEHSFTTVCMLRLFLVAITLNTHLVATTGMLVPNVQTCDTSREIKRTRQTRAVLVLRLYCESI
jgi:hypothetical protein